MKILYVKNNSERAKEFQLKTIIYEENGQKFVKKQALCLEAIPHLKKMKESYKKLTTSIINPKIKLAKIIAESEDSLTFEFIDGLSLEHMFYTALHKGNEELTALIDEYIALLKTSFKVKKSDKNDVSEKYIELFSEITSFSMDSKLSFDGVSNIDLTFSNIIYKEDKIYIIDYEWVESVSVELDFILYRSLELLKFDFREEIYSKYNVDSKNYRLIDDIFIHKYITKNQSFYNYSTNYLKERSSFQEYVSLQNELILKNEELRVKNEELFKIATSKTIRYRNNIKFFISAIKNPTKVIRKISSFLLTVYNEIKRKFEIPSDFNGNVINKITLGSKINDMVCVFSHYDRDNVIDDYVVNYLEKLHEMKIDIVFVSTAEKLADSEIDKIKKLCTNIIIKQNIGYDFGAWKTGLELIDKELPLYKSLILCNDSVYAPLTDMSLMFKTMSENNLDVWSITDSEEMKHHMQSYFLVFNQKVIVHSAFINFWKEYKVYKNKRNIIEKYEVGLSEMCQKNDFSFSAYCTSKKLSTIPTNLTHFYWKDLILKHQCPIIKVELLRDNPTEQDISDWDRFLCENTSYDTTLIKNHLKRINDKK